MVWDFFSQFWDLIVEVGEYPVAYFQNIGLAVAGAIGSFFDVIFHNINDVFVIVVWLGLAFKGIFLSIVSPIVYFFNIVRWFFTTAFQTPELPEVSYGITLQNILPVNFGSDSIGQDIKTGMCSRFLNNKLVLFMDMYLLDIFNKRLFRWGMGVEYCFLESLFTRIGINHRELTFGFGLHAKKFSFDYAMAIHEIDYIHKFSVNLRYGFSPTEEEKQAIENYVQFT